MACSANSMTYTYQYFEIQKHEQVLLMKLIKNDI